MKDYLKDYLVGRRQEEILPHTRENEVPKVPKAAFEVGNEPSVTFGTCRGVGYPENVEAQSAENATDDPEINWRVEAMLSQIPDRGPIPFLVAREAVEPEKGHCFSCGNALDYGEGNRCNACCRAANLAIELSLSLNKSSNQNRLD
ncbi:MAG TPA: hypothetical protein VF131_02490 [Blastocatellia bacterium]|nr:hypothetical protein [Blastocatellia bacterium]